MARVCPGAVVVINATALVGFQPTPLLIVLRTSGGREHLQVYAQLPPKKILHCGSVLHFSAVRLPACVFVEGIPPYD
ncbi:hypothetical protein SAMN05446934_1889 [Paraburkholderia hospita]|jgi:hypothetical protein|nr:hypothetical protein PMI06_009930 [Burkholderia sp. BT03]SKC46160.1 hypothetical protein SAMN06266956_0082 [Paraburkholderia hospita]SKC69192.1 hypothetical protein SAMN05446934_1889 [Paraburkholderia hospita]